jgi:hypothetical protein
LALILAVALVAQQSACRNFDVDVQPPSGIASGTSDDADQGSSAGRDAAIEDGAGGQAGTRERGTATGESGSAGAQPSDMDCKPRDWCTVTDPNACNGGIWPNGVIPYEFVQGASATVMATQAMEDWETVSAHSIYFIRDDAHQFSPRVEIDPDRTTHVASSGYTDCVAGSCSAFFGAADAYHELGHVIGLRNEWQRFDRNRYVLRSSATPTNCSDFRAEAQCSESDALSVLSPFDYESALMANFKHPDLTRWDCSPIVPKAVCNGTPLGILPLQCGSED